MGRKIPAKRHRGVKDPLVQQARREKSLKSKINAPPKDPDEQPIPRSLTRLFAFQLDKQDAKQKRNKHKTKLQASNAAEARRNPVAALRRLAGESGRSFSLRINSAVRALHAPLEPTHYPEELESEDVKGERMAARRDRRRRRAAPGGAAPGGAAPGGAAPGEALTRTQKLAIKKKAKKEKADDLRAAERREVAHERVAFGEVAHAPPALRHAADRPGRRPLLLSAMLRAEPPGRPQAVAAYRDLKRRRRDAAQAQRHTA